ncbi:corticotropin-releasing factor receptor 1-like [Tachypleus tridentatus]|uniref:corticotropin-releasing factor receptor 1-like n=1 Tax=Tachypleus tridentatus TaxID=6853 RepID=UPI003FD13A70
MALQNLTVVETNPGSFEGIDCYLRYVTQNETSDLYCGAAWDGFYCWPPTSAGQIIYKTCDSIFARNKLPVTSYSVGPEQAYRVCQEDGTWLWGNWTNYTECLNLLTPGTIRNPATAGYILFFGSIISLLTLVVTLFIFSYFKSLQCQRLRVHRNLVVSLIIHSILLLVISTPVILRNKSPSYKKIDWLCKTILSLKMYSAMASINWMFLEGLILHSRITTSVFEPEVSFKVYYIIGWGVPTVFILTWSLVLSRDLNSLCWKGYGSSVSVWILTGPMMIVLLINTFFLVNIIRILVTKLRASVSVETAQVRKSIKATALLFPLLGITHLLFCINPRGTLERAYMITNATMQSSQGLFLSVLYCFTNSEVQTTLRIAYYRSVLKRNLTRTSTRRRGVSHTADSSIQFSHNDHPVSETFQTASFKRVVLPLQDLLGNVVAKGERKTQV